MISRIRLFNTSNVHLLSSPTQVCAPISTKSISPSPKIDKPYSPIWSSPKVYIGLNLNYTSNLSRVVDTIHQTQHGVFTPPSKTFNGVYSMQPRKQFIFKKLIVKLSSSVIKHQSHFHPNIQWTDRQALIICHQT